MTDKLYTPKKIYVAKSKIHGNGVFAKKDLKKGEIVFLFKGDVHKQIPKGKTTALANPNWVGVDEKTWIDPRGSLEFINHSCDPNMGIKGRVTFVALRHVQKGEELTFDYSITECDPFWKMNCHCGSKRCRKILGPIQSLPKDVFENYIPGVPHFFRKFYERSKII